MNLTNEFESMELIQKNLTLVATNNDELNLYSIDINLINKIYLPNISKLLNISLENLSNYVIENGANYNDTSQREPMLILIIISIFYGLILVAGILGNLITCIVISRNKSMHTATNFYLFNLAISDLMLLLSGLPIELYNNWYPTSYPFPGSICILESTLLETASNATVLTITAFSVERYIAICHPFRQHTMSKLSRAIKFILAIWLAAFILALPQTMQFGIRIENNGKGRVCSVKSNFIAHVFAVSGCVFFVGPMTAICALYVLIGVKLKKSRLLQGCQRYDLNRGISAQRRVIRMLIAVAVAFFLCWAPFHAQRLMAVYGQTVEPSKLFRDIYDTLTYVSGVLYFLSTCINPLLYNIMSNKFRNAFKVTLARQFGLTSRIQNQNNNYYYAIRQNGSMRVNTTTTLDNRVSHNNIPLVKRESDISLLQEYNLNTSSRANSRGGTPSTNRFCCVSLNSQSTLMTSFSRNDLYNTQQRAVPPATRNDSNSSGSSQQGNLPLKDIKTSTFDINLQNQFECTCGVHGKKSKIKSRPNCYAEPSGSTILSYNFRKSPKVIEKQDRKDQFMDLNDSKKRLGQNRNNFTDFDYNKKLDNSDDDDEDNSGDKIDLNNENNKIQILKSELKNIDTNFRDCNHDHELFSNENLTENNLNCKCKIWNLKKPNSPDSLKINLKPTARDNKNYLLKNETYINFTNPENSKTNLLWNKNKKIPQTKIKLKSLTTTIDKKQNR